MANTRELRRRIKSIKNTSQITKAMQMVAATKMRRAQDQAVSGRPYEQTLNAALLRLIPRIQLETHPLLQPNSANDIGMLVLTTDKGLCGALNTNIFRNLNSFIKEKKDIRFYTLGRKGRQFIVRSGGKLEADFENHEIVIFRQAKQLAKLLSSAFLRLELKEVYIVYPDFISSLKQEPKIVKLLPVDKSLIVDRESLIDNDKVTDKRQPIDDTQHGEFIFEPNPDELLDFVLMHSIETKIYQALLELKASEHSARMIAMQNATDNAKELVEDLQLTYNQTRQEGITRELSEITSAAAALE